MEDWEFLTRQLVSSDDWKDLTDELRTSSQKADEVLEDLVDAVDAAHSESASESCQTPPPVQDHDPDNQVNQVGTFQVIKKGRPLSPKVCPNTGRSPPPSKNLRTPFWWAQLLKQHAQCLGCMDPYQEGGCPVKTLVSGCTGIFAEAEVLRVAWLQHLLSLSLVKVKNSQMKYDEIILILQEFVVAEDLCNAWIS